MFRKSALRPLMSASDWLQPSQVLNEQIVGVQYAVRGKIPERAQEIKAVVQKSGGKKVIECNIGNPQAIGNPYLSFPREVVSAYSAPHLLECKGASDVFAPDVAARAREYIAAMGNNSGGYTVSNGIPLVRKNVARYIERRDQQPEGSVSQDEIFLTDGASRGVQMGLSFIRHNENDGILVPVPQYPLYSATLHMLGMRMCPYFLDENYNWSLNMKSLESAYNLATFGGTNVKGIVLINPGNPTGQVLAKDTVHDVVDFARRRGLAIFADEVYQENVYDEKKEFYSIYRGMRDMPLPKGATDVPLFSFHSTSKGILGECGRRGGYTHVVNLDHKHILPLLNKLASVNLCSNITGQIMTDLMVRPPTAGEASYERYRTEYDTAMASYKKRAKTLVDGLTAIKGITSNAIEGAMYAFPSLDLPERYRQMAWRKNMHPDFCWCMELLEDEHVVVVPGSGFEQMPGSFHFRTTILPGEADMADMVERVARHHNSIMEKYSDKMTNIFANPPSTKKPRKPRTPKASPTKTQQATAAASVKAPTATPSQTSSAVKNATGPTAAAATTVAAAATDASPAEDKTVAAPTQSA